MKDYINWINFELVNVSVRIFLDGYNVIHKKVSLTKKLGDDGALIL